MTCDDTWNKVEVMLCDLAHSTLVLELNCYVRKFGLGYRMMRDNVEKERPTEPTDIADTPVEAPDT